MDEKKKHPLEAEMEAIVQQRPKGKNELIARLSKILNRVDDATFFRKAGECRGRSRCLRR